MPQYTIESVSQIPPTTYFNQKYNSTTYYIKVKLAGHPKPVEIGKKAPDALRAGMTVDGDILPEQNPAHADKFKAAPFNPQGGGQQSFSGSTQSTYKDNSDGQRQGMCFNNAANFINGLADKSVKSTPETWAKSVYEYANALYKLGDLSATTSSEQQNSNVAQLQPEVTNEFGDGFDSFSAGMQASGLSPEEISQIPF